MGITKKAVFSDIFNEMSNQIKALGSPARLHILHYIKSNPNATCMHIVDNILLSQSTISKHLSELKTNNIIQISSLINNNPTYTINNQKLKQIQGFLDVFFELKNYENPIQQENNSSKIETSIINHESRRFSFKKINNIATLKKHNHCFEKK